ncbi:hypothetical protein ACFL0D_05305 [Thermoproteota archaeon]
MAKKVGEYKGFEIWRYEENEVTAQLVFAVKGTDNLPDIPGYRKSEKAANKLVDRTLNGGAMQVDVYKKVPVFYDFKHKRYYASTQYGESTIEKKSRKKEKVLDWINKNTI